MLRNCFPVALRKIVFKEYDKKEKKMFFPIHIIYEPVKHQKMEINCYFSNQKQLAYRSTYAEGGKLKDSCTWECYYCSNYYD